MRKKLEGLDDISVAVKLCGAATAAPFKAKLLVARCKQIAL
ncbi:MAG: hypothetical protein WCD47_08245 [Candidatus Sulfotelmatobacter sp.]